MICISRDYFGFNVIIEISLDGIACLMHRKDTWMQRTTSNASTRAFKEILVLPRTKNYITSQRTSLSLSFSHNISLSLSYIQTLPSNFSPTSRNCVVNFMFSYELKFFGHGPVVRIVLWLNYCGKFSLLILPTFNITRK